MKVNYPKIESGNDLVKLCFTGEWGEKSVHDSTPAIVRGFYRLKAAICMALDREPSRRAQYDLWTDGRVITYIASGTSYSHDSVNEHWFECILVGHGMFTNWWVTIYSASS